MTSGQAPAAGADNAEPAYEWLDDGGANYLLRLDLPGFKKEDLSVHVNGEGLLTVVAQRKPGGTTAGSDGKALRLRKSFQLPSTANLDAIAGRFDGTVLTLTVPKLQQEQQPAGPGAAAATPTPPPAPPQAKEEPGRVAGDDEKPAADREDDKAAKVAREAAERARLTTERSREEDEKAAKPVAPPPAPAQQQPSESAAKGQQRREEERDGKARDDHHHREEVAREAARRIEAARARVAEAKAKAERDRKCEHWKDRAMEEGLKLADTISRNKEAIATAVAAFTLGVFVSSRLFSRN